MKLLLLSLVYVVEMEFQFPRPLPPSFQKLWLKVSQYSQESTYVRDSFYKLADLQDCNFIKNRLNTGVFLWQLLNF